MHLLVGLGNPGASYAKNRHNAGFMAVDAIARRYGFPGFSSKFNGLLADGSIAGEKVYLFKPQNFMNRSGPPVAELARFYKIPLENIVVFHDELDLPLGKIRVKIGGGNGGHNGLKSLDAHLGADYIRVRIGISHPGIKDMVHSHVLSDFHAEEWPQTEKTLLALSEHLSLLLQGDAAGYMNRITLSLDKE